MKREYYLELAANGLRMPIGTDLVLHEKADPEAVMHDGNALGGVIVESARRYNTPLALPLMDLRIEKALLLKAMGVAEAEVDTYHFDATPGEEAFAAVKKLPITTDVRARANVEAIRVAAQEKDLIACGMAIGPFSLMTKLMPDPITAVFMAGSGTTAQEDEEILRLETILELGTQVIEKSIKAQIEAGAKALCLCEPAANAVYFSPHQLNGGSDVFDRYALTFNRRIKKLLADHGVDLIFHDCGELIDCIIERFVTLDPAILSLGASRKLWEDARLVPANTVIFGNLPSKRFYSDDLTSVDDVRKQSQELMQRMKETGKPFILGTECDVLSVPGCCDTIKAKVDAMLRVPALA
jgi:uroporphyrinogen-III decarboxylase